MMPLRTWTEPDIATMREMRERRDTWDAIAVHFHTSRSTIVRAAKEHGFWSDNRKPQERPRGLGKKRGDPKNLTPEVKSELERLVVKTDMPYQRITDAVNTMFGCALTLRQVVHHAKRNGLVREIFIARRRDPQAVEQRLLTRAWNRWAHEPPADNPVRHVPAGTYAARGFTMIGGRI